MRRAQFVSQWNDSRIAEALEVTWHTVESLSKRAVTEGIEAPLPERRHDTAPRKLTGKQEAHLTNH